ncbi:MAG: methyltransferase domain-containing protein [Sphingomonadaceae bacterium]
MTLAQRAIADELMDADDLDVDTYTAVVRDLAKVNTVTLARRPTLRFIDRIAPRHDMIAGPMRILDVGFGDGDMLRAIAHWAARTGFPVTLVGIDLNPRSAVAARRSTAGETGIDWLTGDYADLAGQHWDVVISSLVAHHMTHGELIAFLRFMDAEARAGWFVNDLHRHGFAHWGFPILARLMRWHPIVRHDGRLSIARSYRPGEWPPILAEAGIERSRVTRHFPFRLCVSKIR